MNKLEKMQKRLDEINQELAETAEAIEQERARVADAVIGGAVVEAESGRLYNLLENEKTVQAAKLVLKTDIEELQAIEAAELEAGRVKAAKKALLEAQAEVESMKKNMIAIKAVHDRVCKLVELHRDYLKYNYHLGPVSSQPDNLVTVIGYCEVKFRDG